MTNPTDVLAALFGNPEKTFDYTHADWPEGVVWVYRRDKTRKDDEAIAGMTTRYVAGKIDKDDVRRRIRQGETADEIAYENITQEQVMSTSTATILHMLEGVKVGGKLVEGYTPTPEQIDLMHGYQVQDMLTECGAVWLGRSPKSTEAVSGAPDGVDGPRPAARAAKRG